MSGAWKLCVSFVVLCIICPYVWGQSQNFGTGDITHLLKDDKYVQKQINCVLGKGACDNFGNQLKLAIPEVVNRNCRSCSPQQSANARYLTDYVQKKYPKLWMDIVARYKG